ncbi:hypothetical protein F52700_1157 [Fusarium sp. NRRL 52700]|nr:hypothetical protein F52700_1157 [Fusarium sp. NRRL 52700]
MPQRNEELSQPLLSIEAASNHDESDGPGLSIPLLDLETIDSQFLGLELPVLMDLDQSENETRNHDQDTVMTDVFNATGPITTADNSVSMEIQNTINFDPSWIQLSDQSWLWPNPAMNLAPLPTEFPIDPTSSLAGDLTWPQFDQNGVETLQAQGHRPSYHDLYAPWSPGLSQAGFTSHAMFSEFPTTQTEVVEQQQDVYNRGESHMSDMRTATFASGPVIQQRPLPPVKRGGRSGRMSSEEAREQYMARQNGVCTRCWWFNKKVVTENNSSG